MNMKKTIAAIAAGAVAVSAMATTVSALEAKTLTYNLVKTVKDNESEGKITANFDSLNIANGDKVEVLAIGSDNSWNSVSFEISGSYWDGDAGANKSFNRVYCTEDEWEEGYSIEGSKLMTYGWDSAHEVGCRSVTVPVKAKSAGTEVSLVASAEANIKVVAKYKKLPAGVDSVGALSTKIKNGEMGLQLRIYNGTDSEGKDGTFSLISTTITDIEVSNTVAPGIYTYVATPEAAPTATLTTAGGLTAVAVDAANKDKVVTDTWTYTAQGWLGSDGMYRASIPGVTTTGAAQAGTAASSSTTPAASNGVSISGTLDTAAAKTLGFTEVDEGCTLTISAKATPGAGDAVADITWQGSDGTTTKDLTVAQITSMGLTLTGSATAAAAVTFAYTVAAGTKADVVDTVAGTAATAEWQNNLGAAVTGITVTGGTASNGDKVQVNDDAQDATSVTVKWTSAIAGTASDVKGAGEKKYPYKSTLNNNVDVITNVYSTSDFNDLADGTKEAKLIDANAIRAVINDAVVNYADVTFVFNTAAQRVKDDGTYTPNSWEGTDYTSFSRHFWDSDPGYDANTIYIGQDWLGNNLFEGALIINKNLTLSLGATDKFDWTATSLSFSWDAIQDTALTSNAYANYIHNMVLRTSADWYWDNFQVVLGATEDEDVGTTSPVEAEDEELEESEEDTDVDFEAEEEEEEEPDVDVEPEPEVAPAANPGTGNAPVALAVIPVALAAAAIVAKKRG